MSLSSDITWAAISWLRWEKDADLVCTEVGTHYLKDVCGLWVGENGLPTSMVEIEVKVSMSDLRRDFEMKQNKHCWYAEGRNCPNYLYFAVPQSLASAAVPYISERNSRYGVLSYDPSQRTSDNPTFAGKALTSVHRCRKLTEDVPKPAYMVQMGRRLMNEYLMQKSYIRLMSDRVEGEIERYAKAVVRRERKKLDKYCPLGDDTSE